MTSAASARTTNWAGNIAYDPRRMHRPRTLDELRRTVADSARMRVLGSGHSFSAVAEAPDDVLLLDGLPQAVAVDPASRSVTVSGGVRYVDVLDRVHAEGLALTNLPSLPYLSVAGACATGTHGSGTGLRGLAAAVTALQVIDASGAVVELRRDTDPDFAGAVVNLGALGVVTAVTLALEPAFEVDQVVYVDVPLGELTAELDRVFAAAYSVSVFTDWRSDRAIVLLKRRVDRRGSGWVGGHPATRPVHPVPELPGDVCTQQLGVPGPWHERLPHFRWGPQGDVADELQSEFFVPRAAAPSVLAAVRDLADVLAPVLQISELRTVAADDLWLSPAHARDSMTVHFTWSRNLADVPPVVAAVEAALAPSEARPHWGKITSRAAADIAASYPRMAEFRRLARAMDPSGTFRNPFVDALLADG